MFFDSHPELTARPLWVLNPSGAVLLRRDLTHEVREIFFSPKANWMVIGRPIKSDSEYHILDLTKHREYMWTGELGAWGRIDDEGNLLGWRSALDGPAWQPPAGHE